MAAFLLRLLTIAAMMLAPLAMTAPAVGHPVVPAVSAHHAAATEAMGHCAGADEEPDQGPSSIDCAIACAAVAGVIASGDEPRLTAVRSIGRALPESLRRGLHPEAAIPPPRYS